MTVRGSGPMAPVPIAASKLNTCVTGIAYYNPWYRIARVPQACTPSFSQISEMGQYGVHDVFSVQSDISDNTCLDISAHGK